jgi:hypothetical protein
MTDMWWHWIKNVNAKLTDNTPDFCNLLKVTLHIYPARTAVTQIFINYLHFTCTAACAAAQSHIGHPLSEVHSFGQLMPFLRTVLMISFLFIQVAFHIILSFQLPMEEAFD